MSRPLVSVGVQGEMVRVRHSLERLRAVLRGVELALQDVERGVPPGADPGYACATAALQVATDLAKIDAIMRVQGAK